MEQSADKQERMAKLFQAQNSIFRIVQGLLDSPHLYPITMSIPASLE